MKKRYFLLVIGMCILFVLAGLFAVGKLGFSKIKGDISQTIGHEVIKNYSVGDTIYFDPVKYELCDSDKTSETCYQWLAIKKDGNIYDLLYNDGSNKYNMMWSLVNPVDVIKSYSSNWSTNITVDSSYDVEVTEDYSYKYSETKARILTLPEYTSMSDETKSKINFQGYSAPSLMNDNEHSLFYWYYMTNNNGSERSYEYNAHGSYNSVFYVRPLINIDLENGIGNIYTYEYDVTFYVDNNQYGETQVVLGNKTASEPTAPTKSGYKFKYWSLEENGEPYDFNTPITSNTNLYAVFSKIQDNPRKINLYDTVDFDPVNYRFCDDNYDAETCYRWTVINKNGNEFDLYFFGALEFMKWTSLNPVDIIEEYSSNWDDRLIIRDKSYDVTVNDNVGYYFYGKKARMLTADEYNALNTSNGDYRDRVADYKKLNLIISPDDGYFYNSAPYTEYSWGSEGLYNLYNGYPFNWSYTERSYIKPLIHIDLDNGVGNAEEKERKQYICRRATRNVTEGQIGAIGQLAVGDVFDCNVDGTGFNKRFYYVTDLAENSDYSVLLYDHSVMNGKLYDLSCYKDDRVYTTEQCFEMAYDKDRNPSANGPKTAVNQLPTTEQWTTRLYNDHRDIYHGDGTISVANFSYEGKAARFLSIQEISVACDFQYPIEWSTYINSQYSFPEKCNFIKENLSRLGSYDNGINAYDYWLENSVNRSNASFDAWIVTGPTIGWSDVYARGAYEYNNGTGVRPVIEVPKTKLYYGAKATVTFNDEERLTTQIVNVGGVATPIDSQGKTGYKFKHWSLEKNGSEFDFDTEIIKDTELYAVYEPDNYTITYNLDGGSLEQGKSNPETYNIETDTFTLNNPSKINYEFLGWTGSNGTTPQKEITVTKGSTGNLTYTANYDRNIFEINFYDNDEKIYTMIVRKNETADKDNIPVVGKEGYDFIGWRELNSTTNFDFDTVITRSYDLYSNYKKGEKPKECTLDISSYIYEIDNEKYVIRKVPKDETVEQIEANIQVKGTIKQITSEQVEIECDGVTRIYTIERYWMPHTGHVVVRYGRIISLILIPMLLLILIARQIGRRKNITKQI